MKKSNPNFKTGKCGFCLAEVTGGLMASSNETAGGDEEAIAFFTSPVNDQVSVCNRCVCFLQSLDNQTSGRDENRHKPYANIERVAYGIFRDPQTNGISFRCSYCAKTESRLVFAAPGQDICIECVDHFNSH